MLGFLLVGLFGFFGVVLDLDLVLNDCLPPASDDTIICGHCEMKAGGCFWG